MDNRYRNYYGRGFNSRSVIDYTVIIPVYNGANSLKELHSRISQALGKETNTYEIIYVDDFSSDESWATLAGIKDEDQGHVKAIRLAKNYGQHNATMCGFRHSSGDIVLTMDDDLQHSPEDIPALVKELKDKRLDVVFGVPTNYQHKDGYRKHASKMWKKGSHSLNGALLEGSSFRAIRKSIINKVSDHRQQFIFIDEMLGWYTDIMGVVHVDFNKSAKLKSGYSALKLIRLSLNLGVFYSTVPLKLMTYVGLIMSLATFFWGLWFIYKKVFIGVPVTGYTSLMVTILFSTSVLLMCLGIIGQYLGKIYSVLNNKPTYSIKEQLL